MSTSTVHGAEWIRCDLHVHSPLDGTKSFGEDVQRALSEAEKGDTEKLRGIAKRFVEACRTAVDGEGLDLVAVTDHNSVEGYRHLRPHLDDVLREHDGAGAGRPVILPGVELSIGGERTIHLLVIFARDTPVEQIEGMIQHTFGSRDPFDEEGRPRAAGIEVGRAVKRIHEWCRPNTGEREMDFVILPAHADDSRGIINETTSQARPPRGMWEEMKGQLREYAITKQGWHGFQTRRAFDELPPYFQKLIVEWQIRREGLDPEALTEAERDAFRDRDHWPLIESSDPHAHEDIGEGYTWLKMEVPDVEGIRLALLDPESRLRRSAEGRPEPDHPHIRGISIEETDFIEQAEIPLSPYMTTLIGGRGTGKSTVVELLRYGLDRVQPEDFRREESDVRDRVERMLRKKSARDHGETPGMLLPDHEVTIELQVSGRTYEIHRSTEGVRIESADEDPGSVEDLDLRALIQPRIFSQRQIATIAQDPQAQLREVDAALDQEQRRSITDERKRLQDEIENLQIKRKQIEERISQLDEHKTELRQVRDQLTIIEEYAEEGALDDYKELSAGHDWLQDRLEIVTSTAEAVDDVADRLGEDAEGLEPPPLEGPDRFLAEVDDATRAALDAAREGLREQADELRSARASVEEESQERWQGTYEEARDAYEALSDRLAEEDVDFDEHERLMQKASILENKIEKLEDQGEQLSQVEERIRQVHERLVETRTRLSTLRSEFARELEEEDLDLRLSLQPFGDRAEMRTRLGEVFSGSGVRQEDLETILDFVFEQPERIPERLRALVQALREDLQETQAQLSRIDRDNSSTATLVDVRGRSLTGHFFNALQQRDRIDVQSLERYLPPDKLQIKVRGASGEFRPIEQGSIGLRSTAIISLVLFAGNQPLIIDQPEDDLDNQYVYDVVVQLLRHKKFERQIIMATHNANIPVNGDAELITALDVEDGLGTVRARGSIDRQEMKEAVSEIMEGSEEAFRLRQERYGF